MRSTLRLLTVTVSSAALLLSAAVAHAAPARPPGHPPGIDWRPCEEPDAPADAECGTLRVPVDWSRPWGETIELALARRPATDPAARLGSLVINPGGPGGSGVDTVLYRDGRFSGELRRQFDLVGFDPRGVGRSSPVLCSSELSLSEPPYLLTSQADFDAMVEFNRRLADDCREHTGPVFDHVDTLSVVDDLDAIRAALGDQRLTYLGISYGTLIGQQYAQRYPHRVRAVALDSVMDHSLGTRQFMVTETESLQASFDMFVDWCDRSPECALHGLDVREVWAEVLARADRGELPDPTDPDRTWPASAVIELAFGSFYGPDWHVLAELLAVFHAGGAPQFSVDEQEPPELVANPFRAVFCQDWELPLRDYRAYERQLRRLSSIAPDVRYSPLGISPPIACLGWPDEAVNPQQRLRVPPGPRLLLGNSLADPATGYNWAVSVERQLGRSGVLLTYEGAGHAVYGRSDCVTDVFDAYLVRGELPARGTRCPAVDPEPPGPPADQRSAPSSPSVVPLPPGGPLPPEGPWPLAPAGVGPWAPPVAGA